MRTTTRRIAARVAGIAIFVLFVGGLIVWLGRDKSVYPGTVDRPAEIGTSRVALHERGGGERLVYISRLMEIPLADGYSGGRCYVAFGLYYDTRELPAAERTLTVTYAVDGTIVATGDPTAPCDAAGVERAAESIRVEGIKPLDWVLAAEPGWDRHFVTVAYVLGDTEPNSVVVATRTPTAGEAIPSHSAIYTFQLSDVHLDWGGIDAEWNEYFGFGRASSTGDSASGSS